MQLLMQMNLAWNHRVSSNQNEPGLLHMSLKKDILDFRQVFRQVSRQSTLLCVQIEWTDSCVTVSCVEREVLTRVLQSDFIISFKPDTSPLRKLSVFHHVWRPQKSTHDKLTFRLKHEYRHRFVHALK